MVVISSHRKGGSSERGDVGPNEISGTVRGHCGHARVRDAGGVVSGAPLVERAAGVGDLRATDTGGQGVRSGDGGCEAVHGRGPVGVHAHVAHVHAALVREQHLVVVAEALL